MFRGPWVFEWGKSESGNTGDIWKRDETASEGEVLFSCDIRIGLPGLPFRFEESPWGFLLFRLCCRQPVRDTSQLLSYSLRIHIVDTSPQNATIHLSLYDSHHLDEPTSFRILVLQPSRFGNVLRERFVLQGYGEGAPGVRGASLLYTWGGEFFPETVYIENDALNITKSLSASALKQLRRSSR